MILFFTPATRLERQRLCRLSDRGAEGETEIRPVEGSAVATQLLCRIGSVLPTEPRERQRRHATAANKQHTHTATGLTPGVRGFPHSSMVVGSQMVQADNDGDVENELRGMTLGQEGDEEDSGDDEVEATTPGGRKKRSLVKGVGKGIKNLFKSTFSGKDDPVCASIQARVSWRGVDHGSTPKIGCFVVLRPYCQAPDSPWDVNCMRLD